MSPARVKHVGMPFVRAMRFVVVAIIAAASAGCPAGTDVPTEPKLPTGFAITFEGPVTIPQNASVSVPVTVTREAGFTGAVTLSSDVKGAGITVANATIPSGETVGTMVITGDGTRPPGDGPLLTIIGSAAGYATASATRTTLILAGGSFKIQTSNALNTGILGRAEANPGFTLRRGVGISRNQYTKAITFKAGSVYAANSVPGCARLCGPAITGFTLAFTPQPTSGDSVTFLVSVPSSMPGNLYELMLTGTGPDGVKDSTYENFLVRSPTFDFGASSPVSVIPRGGSSTALVKTLRDPGFTGVVTVTLESPTAGISATSMIFPATQETLDFPIQVSTTAAIGKHDATVTGTTPGQPALVRPITVEVQGFDLKARAATLAVVAGSSVTDTVDINRYAFTAPVTFSATSDQGVTIRADSVSPSGNRVIMTVETTLSTSAGRHSVIVKGTSGTTVETTTFNVDVTSSAPTAPTIVVSPTSLSMQTGDQKSVTATVTNASGTAPVVWTSKDPTIVTVSPTNVAASATGAATTFVAVKAGGPVDVVASYTANGTTVTKTVSVTVSAPPSGSAVVAMYLDPIAAEYTPSSGNFYRARLINAQGGEVAPTTDGGTIRYTSSDTVVINIDSVSGLAATARTQVGTKTASITAVYRKNGQIVATAPPSPVTVYPSGGTDMGSVQFSIPGDARRITIGQAIQFQVVVRDQNGIQQTSLASPPGPLDVTSSSSSSLQITAVPSTNGFFYTMTAKALPATSAITGIPNVVTLKADVGGAMSTIPIIILP